MKCISVLPVVPIMSFIALELPIFVDAHLAQMESEMIRHNTTKIVSDVK